MTSDDKTLGWLSYTHYKKEQIKTLVQEHSSTLLIFICTPNTPHHYFCCALSLSLRATDPKCQFCL